MGKCPRLRSSNEVGLKYFSGQINANLAQTKSMLLLIEQIKIWLQQNLLLKSRIERLLLVSFGGKQGGTQMAL